MVDNDRRRYLKQIPLVVASMSAAGCMGGNQNQNGNNGQNGSSSGSGSNWVYDVPQKPPDPLKVVTSNTLSGDPAVQHHFKTFEEVTGWSVEVTEIPEQNVRSKAQTQLQAKSRANDVWEMEDSEIVSLARKGYWEKVDDFIETTDAWSEPVKSASTFPKDYFEDYPYPEGLYAAPQYINSYFLITNKDVLEQAGLEREFQPKTFSEVLGACEELSGTINTPILFPFAKPSSGYTVFAQLVQRAGGHMYKDGNYDFVNDGFIKAADFFLTLVSEGYAPVNPSTVNTGRILEPFYDNQAAFLIGGAIQIIGDDVEALIDRPAEEIAQLNILPKPENAGNTPVGDVNVIMYALSIFSEHKEAGAKYMNIVTQKEEQAQELILEGNVPARPDALEMDIVKQEVPYSDVIKEYVANAGRFTMPDPNRVRDTVHTKFSAAFANGWSAEQLAEAVQTESDSF